MKQEKWSWKELDILRREFANKPTSEIAKMLGRSKRATATKASLLGLKKKSYGIVWTPQQIKLLKDFFPIMFNKPLAKWIGVSQRTMIRKARELGIEKIEGFLDIRRDEINQLNSEAHKKMGEVGHWFKKGERANPAGEFKKGNIESAESKAKRSESLKRAWAKRKQQEKTQTLIF